MKHRQYGFCFDLFGVECFPIDSLYGFWFGMVERLDGSKRCFLSAYYCDGDWYVDFLWMRVFTR